MCDIREIKEQCDSLGREVALLKEQLKALQTELKILKEGGNL